MRIILNPGTGREWEHVPAAWMHVVPQLLLEEAGREKRLGTSFPTLEARFGKRRGARRGGNQFLHLSGAFREGARREKRREPVFSA